MQWRPIIFLCVIGACVLEVEGLKLDGLGNWLGAAQSNLKKTLPLKGETVVDVPGEGGKGSASVNVAELKVKAGSAKATAPVKVEANDTLARFMSTSLAMQRIAFLFLVHSLIQALFVIQRRGMSWAVVPQLIGCCTIECCYAALIFSASRVFDRYEDDNQVDEAMKTLEHLFKAFKVPLLIKLLLMVLSVVNNSFNPRLLQRFPASKSSSGDAAATVAPTSEVPSSSEEVVLDPVLSLFEDLWISKM